MFYSAVCFAFVF